MNNLCVNASVCVHTYLYVYKETNYEELTHDIMDAGKSQDLQGKSTS
jgi:hypothetical protein